MEQHVIIIGASVAGVGAANELRATGFKGRVTLIDAQTHLPYDRPPLSKGALAGPADAASLAFHDAAHYATIGVELLLGVRVTSLDAATRTITLSTGQRMQAEHIVLAPGARARPFPGASEGVITLREMDDALGLKAQLLSGRQLAVIGGGFIGAEVASSARQLGLEVTLFELEDVPFMRILGREVASRLAALHQGAAVTLQCGVRVQQVVPQDGRYVLRLSDGTTHMADVVVAGLGAIPNTEFLAGSGVQLEGGGIMCDDTGSTAHLGIHAAGDAASWPNPHGYPRHRDEHWTSAREQGRIVAREITGQPASLWREYVPYFWSDMHGKRVQVLGSPQYADEMRVVFEDPAKGSFLAEYGRKGVLVGVAGCNAAVRLMKYRATLAQPSPFVMAA